METNNTALIDTSYIKHFAFYSTINWYKDEYNVTEEDIVKEYPNQFDPFKDGPYTEDFKAEFVSRFLGVSVENAKRKIWGLQDTEIHFVLDCPRDKIWRCDVLSAYKGTRAAASKKRATTMGGLEDFMRDTVYPLLKELNHTVVPVVPTAEADDVIGIAVKMIKQANPDAVTIVVTSDSDLYQLTEDCTIFDATGVEMTLLKVLKPYLTKEKKIPESLKSLNPMDYILLKSFSGDKADNISSIHTRCGPKTALKYWEDPSLLENKIKLDESIAANIEKNVVLMDILRLPSDLFTAIRSQLLKSIPNTNR